MGMNTDTIIAKCTLFDQLEKIGDAHKGTGSLPDSDFADFYELIREPIDAVSQRLRITPFQAVLFADILHLFFGTGVDIKALAAHIGCEAIKLGRYLNDIEVLEERDLLSIDYNKFGNYLFELSSDLLMKLVNNEISDETAKENLSAEDLFLEITKVYDNRTENRFSYKRAVKAISFLLNCNRELPFVKTFKSYMLSPEDEFFLLFFCHCKINRDTPELDHRPLERLYNRQTDFIPVRRLLNAGIHPLQKKGLLEHPNNAGFADVNLLCLSEKAEEELLLDMEQLSKPNPDFLFMPDSITEKALFYPEKTAAQIDELQMILSAARFDDIQKNLAAEGMRTGFACLFSGGPGTGKTETALQIAKRTGRAIFKVDIADTKSKWFGESERKIKEIFTKYRRTVKNSPLIPVLLFNEADAVIGKRNHLDGNDRGPRQTENAIQNIILEEIENLTGILIATTNLTCNMDSAFERRFLYKINFEKPTVEARKNIWLSTLKHLSADDADTLAARFEFSGGQIENIARKETVFRIIHGEVPSIEKIIEYCTDELLDTTAMKTIGFSAA
jgi:hypothetical protein